MAGSEIQVRAWNPQRFEGLYRCVHCGLCLDACPTYGELRLEGDSPRGRLYLMRALVEQRLQLNSGVVEHMERCLVCRACETACPSGVRFGELMELTRDEIRRHPPGSGRDSPWRRVMLRHVVPFPARMRAFAAVARFYQQSGLQMGARRLGLVPRNMAEAESLLPPMSQDAFEAPPGEWFKAPDTARKKVGLLAGCIMSVAFADIDRATIRVLNRNGCDVFVPRTQGCCGALHAHDGDRPQAAALALANVKAFGAEDLDAVIVNAAGCGAVMKEYGTLLPNNPQAQEFAERVRDVSEFLDEIGMTPPRGHLDATVTYQDACHLAHAQRVREAPRRLLRLIPGLKLVEMRQSDRCCGSAGIYNVTQPRLAAAIGEAKCATILETGADIVASANPGCMIQLRAGLREKAGTATRVKHVIELLDEAYQAEEG